MLLRVIIIAFIAGSVGTFAGGIVGVIIKKPSKNYIAMMLGFAGGAMLGVSLFELMPESYEHGGIWAALIGVIFGAVFVFCVDTLKNFKDKKRQHLNIGIEPENVDSQKLLRMGMVIFIAIILHSLPEGIAIGAGEHIDIGILTGIIILLHNIPEGMAFALPLKASGMKTWKVLLFSFLAGLPILIGAIAGYFIGMNETLIAYALSFASGAMLYVVFSEMLPTSYSYSSNRKLVTLSTMIGIIVVVVFAIVLH